jgi:hypothetical protein
MVNRASGRSVHTSCDKLRPRGRNRCRGPDIASPAIRRLNWPSPAIDGDALYAAGRVRRPFSAVTVRERVRPCSDRCCWELGDDCVCGHAIVGKQSDELVQQHVEICKVGRLVMLVDHAVVGGRIVSSSASPVIQMRTAPSRVGASNSVTTKGLSWFGSIGCVCQAMSNRVRVSARAVMAAQSASGNATPGLSHDYRVRRRRDGSPDSIRIAEGRSVGSARGPA